MKSNFKIFVLAYSIFLSLVFQCEAYEMGKLKVLLLNLGNRTDKLEISKYQLSYLGLNFERLDAIDGNKFQQELKNNQITTTPEEYTGIKGLALKRENMNSAAGSTLGCWLTHLKALQWITDDVDDVEDRPTLIFEDDFLADADAMKLMNDVFDNIPQDWDIIHVGHCTTRSICTHYINRNRNVCKARKKMIPCTHAYIVKNKRAASELFKTGNKPFPVLADGFFHHASNLNTYVVFPHIFKQLKSIRADIGSEGGNWERLRNTKLEELVNEAFINKQN